MGHTNTLLSITLKGERRVVQSLPPMPTPRHSTPVCVSTEQVGGAGFYLVIVEVVNTENLSSGLEVSHLPLKHCQPLSPKTYSV
jgi:hypothetical protein